MNPGVSKTPPEEKLLRLIRGKSGAPTQSAASGAGPVQMASVGSARRSMGLPGWLVPLLNTVLVLAIVAELAGLVWCMVAPMPELTMATPPSAAPTGDVTAVEPAPSLATTARPLFEINERRAEADAAPKAQGPSVESRAAAAKLSLIGVVSGDPPQAIIEDSETHKTSFLTKGQMVDGMVLEEIHENRVVLSLNGERIELSL